ncbi:MAG: hypothetical protein QOG46_2060, partial [Pseudonocardiales bacterium]|nr:hypothetical protein [Pseudonocardiales bacterium]
LLADRRLHDVQSLSRATEMQLLGNGNEVMQLAKLHQAAAITIHDQSRS